MCGLCVISNTFFVTNPTFMSMLMVCMFMVCLLGFGIILVWILILIFHEFVIKIFTCAWKMLVRNIVLTPSISTNSNQTYN